MEYLGWMKLAFIVLMVAAMVLSIKGKKIPLAITSICAAALSVVVFVCSLKNGEPGQMAIQNLYAIPELMVFYIFRE